MKLKVPPAAARAVAAPAMRLLAGSWRMTTVHEERWRPLYEACEARARHEDPTGRYAGFPCWAREAFGRGTQGGGRRH